MFNKVEPRVLAVGLILFTLAYLIFPFDLIPDFLGLPGRVDDLLLAAWAAWFYRSRVSSASEPEQGPGAGAKPGADHTGFAGEIRSSDRFDPYAILEVEPSASRAAIKAAYRARMSEYHPDKVAHLGAALQEVAHERSQEIQRAYQLLNR